MDRAQATQEIKRLTELINRHNDLYFRGVPEISDYAFDQLLAQLAALEEQFPDLRSPDSPTQRVGETHIENFPTVYHRYPMRSLSNTYAIEDLQKFITRAQKALEGQAIAFFCELKFDGLAVSLIYEKRMLKRVVTRGDGEKG